MVAWLLTPLTITVRANAHREESSEEERREEELHNGDCEFFSLILGLFVVFVEAGFVRALQVLGKLTIKCRWVFFRSLTQRFLRSHIYLAAGLLKH